MINKIRSLFSTWNAFFSTFLRVSSGFIADWKEERIEQNHDFHAQNDWIEGVDFLRKSTLGSRGIGYTYRGFALGAADFNGGGFRFVGVASYGIFESFVMIDSDLRQETLFHSFS